MSKEEFIKSVKGFTDNYVSVPYFENSKWEHYSDEAWGKIYDLGNVYHTSELFIGDKASETRKMVATDEWFINWFKREFEQAKRRGVEIELHILGAVIQKDCCGGPDGFTDGGWIRYIKIKKDE